MPIRTPKGFMQRADFTVTDFADWLRQHNALEAHSCIGPVHMWHARDHSKSTIAMAYYHGPDVTYWTKESLG